MTSCTSIHTESIVIIWSIKPEEKEKVVYHAHSTEEDFRNSFIRSNQLSPIVKYLVGLYQKRLSDHANTLFKQLLESYGIRVPIQAISNGIDLEKYPDPMKEQSSENISNCLRIKSNHLCRFVFRT